MPKNLIQIFVSCPGDVTAEKDIIKKVVSSFNSVLIKENHKLRFEVLDIAEGGDF